MGVVAQSLARPYRVPASMVLLIALVPFYIFIPELLTHRTRYAPEIAFDRALPLLPAWALVYGALYGFLILLPVLVVRDYEQIRATVHAYLFIWLTAYVFFLAYPTAAPRPQHVVGDSFAAAGLRFLYESDPPFNCFPSLHVAHSFVSALACFRVHRGVAISATCAAVLVALSTLFTKQHYVVDVVAGVALALIAALLFLRKKTAAPELDRRAAPILAAYLAAFITAALAGAWLLYLAAWN